MGRVGKRVQPISPVSVELVQAKAVQRIARWRVQADASSRRVTQRIVGAVEKLVVWGSVAWGACAKVVHAILPNVAGMIVWICKVMEYIVAHVVVHAYRAKCAKKAVVRACRGWRLARRVVRISRRIRKIVGRVERLVRKVGFVREDSAFRLVPMPRQRYV